MEIVVDAMSAEYGGIRTYVEHLLGHWSTVHPDDDVHVAVPIGSSLDTHSHNRHELRVRRPTSIGRPAAQSFEMHRLIQQLRPDAVLAAVPSTAVRRPGFPLAVVIYDLRHEMMPEQFTRVRRMMRRFSYGRSYRLADGFIAISERSLVDLNRLHPSTADRPASIAHLGGDHVLKWPRGHRHGPAVAFAHHTNKNPDLILDAWTLLAGGSAQIPELTILGVDGRARTRLGTVVRDRGLGDYVTLAPFLPDEEFQRVMTEASMIVFPSNFEGFGLPVVEGMILGKPVVIGPERATTEIAGGHAVIMTGWTDRALAEAVSTAHAMDEDALAAARAWGLTYTWERTVRETRGLLARLASETGPPPPESK